GTYYFWVKAAPSHYLLSTTSSAFSKVSNSVSFTHQDLPVPTDLRASLPIEANSIILDWTSTKAPYYHLYMNTENNSETATLYSSYSSNYAVVLASKLTSGTTYYFWVKSADTSSSDSLTSGFSNVASYTWSE
nr:hypothetical protein [Treponema sp.]